MNAIRAAVLAAVAVLVVACAPPKVPYERADTIKSIGVVTPRFPEGAVVHLASSVGQSFGLIGALIDAGMQADRESKFKVALEQQKFSVQDCFLHALKGELETRGYAVNMIPVERDGADFVAKYPKPGEPSVDAYLDLVTINYGYIAAGIGSATPYRPLFALKVRLVSARDSSLLMQDTVIYNAYGNATDVVTIAPDPAYGFATFDDLMVNSANAAKGLQTATEQSAQAVGRLLQ